MHRNPHFILIDVEKNFSNSTIYNPLKSPWRRDKLPTPVLLGFPGGSADKESTYNAGDLGSICLFLMTNKLQKFLMFIGYLDTL